MGFILDVTKGLKRKTFLYYRHIGEGGRGEDFFIISAHIQIPILKSDIIDFILFSDVVNDHVTKKFLNF